uniref:hypothetical protein n=1 Tax=Geobacter argillaceus TaxID=345631 RepID=UPI0038B3EA59
MMRVTTRFMKSRSWLVIRRAPSNSSASHSSSQMIDSTSRWLVGSSRRITSGLRVRILARAIRIFQPPLNDSTGW